MNAVELDFREDLAKNGNNSSSRQTLLQSLKFLPYVIAVCLFSTAIWLLHHELTKTGLQEILSNLRMIRFTQLLDAFAFTSLSFLVLTCYDALALKHIQYPLPYSRIALGSFISCAFSQSLGFHLLTSASIRYKLYSSWKLEASQIAKLIFFTTITFWLGILTIAGVSLIGEPQSISQLFPTLTKFAPVIGILLCSVVCLYLIWGTFLHRPISIRKFTFSPPSTEVMFLQVVISVIDWSAAAAVLYVIIGPVIHFNFLQFVGIFVLAQTFGVVSHVPGGLGVFEGAILFLLGPSIPVPAVIGGLLAYRFIYYIVPLLFATALFGIVEVRQVRQRFIEVWDLVETSVSRIAPSLLALLVFLSGIILLFSGATPGIDQRLSHLNPLVPLPLLETSHLIGSVAGAALLILARGLQRRLDGAYIITICLLATGAVASVVKGLDYEEAMILCLILLVMVPARRFFYRKASLLSESFSPTWIISILSVLIASIWLGMFSYKHVEYSHDLWWQFTLNGNAPRFLRATVGALGITFCFAVIRILRPATPEPFNVTLLDLKSAKQIVDHAGKTYANLALLGDKRLLFSGSHESFLMYNVEGRSWITMGDPVGKLNERSELLWKFRELCDFHDAWPVFYEVARESIPLYLDLGLTLLKIGEEARVSLDSFCLEGASRKTFRNQLHKLARAGCVFEVIPQEKVPEFMPVFKEISESWLIEKRTREKGFSLGFFNEDYLLNFPAGIVRQNGKILAFVNIWQTSTKEELSVDLMRYTPDAPPGVMEFLFLQLMLWGKSEGYHWFNLGMAPFSGIQNHPMAPMWNKFGALLFRHGEHFYNFQGLRLYKEKFDPVWQPRYLASPAGLALPRILANVASLVSGGLKGVIAK